MMDEEIKEEAVPFLIYDQNKKMFTLTEQGEEVIKSLKGEFGVISVAGMYRTGKSYLLNRMLLNRQKGFSVGPTVNPCTKGLWVWSKPIYGNSEEGSHLPLLLIDTEGFGALDEDSNHDIRIFTLSILLSSYFVYNSLGSIDENALQNLNFVINLSKYIKLNNNENEVNPDELANLFPSFLWILRDFTLQLIESNGEVITPKEYLETVLEGGKSSNQDPKNKIRKLIKSYFKDRDCFTMVRPLTNEGQLQSLESLEPDKLRPEFLEQILQLRKKILSRVKVKTLKGKALTSEMYLNFIKSLVASLNSGSIPNIENTWSSMCRVESYKAFEEAEMIYDNYLKENLENTNKPLDQIHKEAKEKSMEVFKQKALGEIANEFNKELRQKMKDKYNYYSKLQDEETKSKIIRILSKWYSILESRIQGDEFKSLEDINIDFISLEEKLNETFPSYNGKTELFNDFKTKVFAFAGEHVSSKAANDMKYLKEESVQQIDKLTNDIEVMKSTHQKETEKKNNQLNENKAEIIELKEQIANLKESLAVTEKEKDITANNFNSQLSRMKEDFERKLKDSEQKKNMNEEKQKEAERRLITIKAESDKEKALLNQKVDHLSKLIDDSAKREKEAIQEMKSQLKEQSIAFKDKQDKYESTIKKIQNENESYKERLIDCETTIQNNADALEKEKLKNDEMQLKMNKDIKDLNDKLTLIKKQSKEEKAKMEADHLTKENELLSQINQLQLKVKELEQQIKNNENAYKSTLAKLEREIAISKQENSLLKTQNEDLIGRIEEQKRYYENIISNLESKTFTVDHEEFQKKIDEIKDYYEQEKKKGEEFFEKSKSTYINQIDQLNEKLSQSTLTSKNIKDDYEKEVFELKLQLDKITKEYNTMLNEKKDLNNSYMISTEEANAKLKETIVAMEHKLEAKEHNHQEEIHQLNNTAEETLSQLKALFETEKVRLEEKLKDEKAKNDKKIKTLFDDYELKVKDIEQEYKEENENLQNDLDDLNKGHCQYVSNAEREMEILNQKIENAESALREAKETISFLTEQNKNGLDSTIEGFNKERKEFQLKIDQIYLDFNAKEKEYAAIQAKRDLLEKTISEKDDIISRLKDDLSLDKLDALAKYEELKKKLNEVSDQNMIKQLEYTRENALLTQQIEFLNKKNDESNKQIESNQKRYEERLFSLRTEVEKDLSDKFERIKIDKEELEGKLIAKKREIKEIEQSFTKQLQQITKEFNESTEKTSMLQRHIDEMNKTALTEKASLEKTIASLTAENNSYKENFNSNDKSLKMRVAKLEAELIDKTNQYEKEHILWDGKLKFVEQQRDTLKKDSIESSRRFEALLDTIQKRRNSEKEKIETATQNAIASLEQKYQKQIKDIQENHNKLYTELLNNNKQLDRELKNLTLQNEMNKNKNYNPLGLARQIEEMAKEKDKYKLDEESKKSERDSQLNDLKNQYEKEKEALRKKINDIEKSLRDVEVKRGALVLELEKEKVKWDIEKNNLENRASELNDKLAVLERKNESLLRENERLKNERNNLRKAGKNDAKYSIMFRDNPTSFLGGSTFSKGTESNTPMQTQTKTYTSGNMPLNYQNQMYNMLGENELSNNDGSKIDYSQFDSTKYDKPISPTKTQGNNS